MDWTVNKQQTTRKVASCKGLPQSSEEGHFNVLIQTAFWLLSLTISEKKRLEIYVC